MTTDSTRKMRVVSSPHQSLLITRLQGHEGLSELYSFELDVQLPHHVPFNIFDSIGQDFRIEIEVPSPQWFSVGLDGELPQAKVRRFCGMVFSASELYEDDHFRYFKVRIAPRLWLATQRSNCRIFQEMTAPEVIRSVLEGVNLRTQLRDDYPARPYCVQYNETDCDFISRLAAEEGIFFYFEHSYEGQDDPERQRGERLVFTDSVASLPITDSGFATSDEAGEEVEGVLKYDMGDGGTRDGLLVKLWHKSQRIVSTKCTVRDHLFQLPDQTLEAAEEVVDSVCIDETTHQLHLENEALEQFNYPGDYAKYFDGVHPGGGERPQAIKQIFGRNAQTAKGEVGRFASDSISIFAESNCLHLSAGEKFSLLRNERVSGPYFVKAITHSAQLNADFRTWNGVEAEAGDELKYENAFSVQAELQPYFPSARVQKPKILGVQTATVVTPDKVEVASDRFGRIKVHFNWDRRPSGEDASCWIRVAQVWAGNRWGAFFWPRVGHEVVVAFEHGDPDRPLIIGSVYNAKNMPPMELPGRLMSCGIKSCTVGGNPLENYSCVVFHDGVAQEYLQLHSETHECLTSETAKLSSSTGPGVKLQGGSWDILGYFGSGAGGGPSSASVATTAPSGSSISAKSKSESRTKSVNQPKATVQSYFIEPQVVEAIQRLESLGSGAGGLIAGIMMGSGVLPTRGSRAAKAAEVADVGNLQGGLEVTSGNKLDINLGAEKIHCFANMTEVVADMEGLVESLLMSALGALAGSKADVLKWKMGGYLCQVYGNKKEITYGHLVDIHRGSETKVTAEHFFSTPDPKDVAETYGMILAQTTSVFVRVTAILVLLFNLAMAIAIKVLMEKPTSGDEEEGEDRERQLQPWKNRINTLGKWNSTCESILLMIQGIFEQLYAELTHLENGVQKTEKQILDITVLGTRLSTWRDPKPVMKQKIANAKKWFSKNATILLGLAVPLAFLAIAIAAVVMIPKGESDK